MHRPSYAIARAVSRFIGGMSVRHVVVHGERLRRSGPFVLACTHVGHLEPLLVATVVRRPVHWVARIEFFRNRLMALLMRQLGTVPLDRRGVPIRAFRTAARLLADGQILGIFPEGGRTHGERQVVRGGGLKGGACSIALRAGVPIVPVVMLGVDRLHAVGPWLPGRRTIVWTIVGVPIAPGRPVARPHRQSRRRAMTLELTRAMVDLHAELVAKVVDRQAGRDG